MPKRSEPPRSPATLRDEIMGLGRRSLRKSYYGTLQRNLAELARFRALLDAASDAIVLVELPGCRIVDANRAGRELLNMGGDDPGGRPLSEFFSAPVWRRFERLVRLSASRSGGGRPLVLRARGVELEIASREERFDASRYLVLVGRDVTEQRRAARALLAAKHEAQRLARAKSEFLSIVSHELRTPLTSLQLRLQQTIRSDHAGASLAEYVLRPVRRLSTLVEQILEVSRMERAGLELSRARVDLRELAVCAVEEVAARFAPRPLRLAPGDPAVAVVDPLLTKQLLASLLENAVKFSPAGSPIDVRVWTDARHAHVAVVDHGPGIPREERERLFTPFSRLADTRNVPGLGLGLYVARQVARRHGGDVVAGDTQGGGATLTVRLPLAPESRG